MPNIKLPYWTDNFPWLSRLPIYVAIFCTFMTLVFNFIKLALEARRVL